MATKRNIFNKMAASTLHMVTWLPDFLSYMLDTICAFAIAIALWIAIRDVKKLLFISEWLTELNKQMDKEEKEDSTPYEDLSSFVAKLNEEDLYSFVDKLNEEELKKDMQKDEDEEVVNLSLTVDEYQFILYSVSLIPYATLGGVRGRTLYRKLQNQR